MTTLFFGALFFGGFLGWPAGLAIKPLVVDVARLPKDAAGVCLLAQPFAADDAMGFSRLLIFCHVVQPPVHQRSDPARPTGRDGMSRYHMPDKSGCWRCSTGRPVRCRKLFSLSDRIR